jgi:hypothetical protein
MSRFTGNIGPEEEDGLGWDGLVPTKAEREEERLHTELRKLKSALAQKDAALEAAYEELWGYADAGCSNAAEQICNQIRTALVAGKE